MQVSFFLFVVLEEISKEHFSCVVIFEVIEFIHLCKCHVFLLVTYYQCSIGFTDLKGKPRNKSSNATSKLKPKFKETNMESKINDKSK